MYKVLELDIDKILNMYNKERTFYNITNKNKNLTRKQMNALDNLFINFRR